LPTEDDLPTDDDLPTEEERVPGWALPTLELA
jgi:hypothetical protein